MVFRHGKSAEKSGRVDFGQKESFLSEGDQIGSIPVNPTVRAGQFIVGSDALVFEGGLEVDEC